MSNEGAKVARANPLPEHPRPQAKRKDVLMLNGEWDFSINKNKANPNEYDSKIVVPFAVETSFSSVGRRIGKDDFLHYRRTFDVPEGLDAKKAILHFDAVDQVADVYVNGVFLAHHEGGYLPFSMTLTDLKAKGNVIEVSVNDDTDSEIFPRGKQMNENKGIWYTPTSGIWQSVWLEFVPDSYIDSFRIHIDYDKKEATINAKFVGSALGSTVKASFKGETVDVAEFDANGEAKLHFDKSFHPWSPEEANLYDLLLIDGEDSVESYLAMRKFGSIEHEGHLVLALNNKPYFASGVLDQGYWPESGLTAPSDQAMIDDILLLKDMGFNMVRKHIKIEPLRWYYHCDRLGLLVMQDFISGGAPYKKILINLRPFIEFNFNDKKPSIHKLLGRGNIKSQERFIADMPQIIDHLFNVPSIYCWVLFNEGWGQFDTVKNFEYLLSLDDSRTIDANSGWYDQKVGDYSSRHIYFRKAKIKNDKVRMLSLSEFGGYSLKTPGHMYDEKSFGYKEFKDAASLNEGMKRLYEREIIPLMKKEGLSTTVYTQLSDVEQEINGLITYDRKVIKVDKDLMRSLNNQLKFE
ncbi:MAG: glycoside hydrolase family 2 [Bacilli bacterium]|nr:glycoside hydrolase family 2 [Bacilli bacterium]